MAAAWSGSPVCSLAGMWLSPRRPPTSAMAMRSAPEAPVSQSAERSEEQLTMGGAIPRFILFSLTGSWKALRNGRSGFSTRSDTRRPLRWISAGIVHERQGGVRGRQHGARRDPGRNGEVGHQPDVLLEQRPGLRRQAVERAAGRRDQVQGKTRPAAVRDDVGEAERVDVERLPESEDAGRSREVGREQDVVEQLGDLPGPERAQVDNG